jgi:uncharacterized RDD family membrane protein YckC
VERTVSSTHRFPAGAAERQGQRAGVVSRTLAMVIDIAYVGAITAFVYLGYVSLLFVRRPARFTWPQTSFSVLVVFALILAVLMLTIAWSGLGRTMGMRVMGLRLQTNEGERVHLVRAFLRAFTCVAVPLGLFWSAVSKRNASAQDLLFRTSVIYDWESRVPDGRGD